jgi:hypothetical protein
VTFAAESPNKAYRYLEVRESARDAIEEPLDGMNKRELSERDIRTKVEKDDKAFAELSRFVGTQGNLVEVHPLHGTFGDHVTSIERLIGDEAARPRQGAPGSALDLVSRRV